MCVAHPFLSVAFGAPWRNRHAYTGALDAARALRALWGALNWSRVLPYDAARAADGRDLIARF